MIAHTYHLFMDFHMGLYMHMGLNMGLMELQGLLHVPFLPVSGSQTSQQ